MLSGMHMVFGPGDQEGFLARRDSLLGHFESWLGAAPPAHTARVASEAGLALDWKWSYADGDLGKWTTADVREFLLDWCPRKLSVSQADCASIPDALMAFIAFLDAAGFLASGSSSVAALAETAARLSGEFVEAMGDESNFGIAKSLFGAAAAEGVDLTDPDRLQEWMAEFNERPLEDRRRIIPDTALAAPKRATLPPVALPDDAEVAASKAKAPILAMFARLAEFVGDGRKLTQTGNLTLADARALVDLLGTGDAMDQRIGDHTYRTRSSAELPRLRQVFAWARKAGVVRVARGRVVATKRGLAIGADPASFFDRAVDSLLALGVLASQRDPDWWLAWPEVTELLDRFVVHLLAVPYVAQRPLPIDDLASASTEAVLSAFEFRTTHENVARHVATDVVDIVDVLELAGLLHRGGMADADEPELVARRRYGGSVELTAAGLATTHRLLTDAGYGAPITGRFSDATAAELLLGTDLDDFAVLGGESQVWRHWRQPADAARGMADAVRTVQDPALRNLALAVMGDMEPEVAMPEVRRLATETDTRGFAQCWLVDHGFEPSDSLFDPDDVSWFVDVLAHRLVTGGTEGLCDTLALAGSHEGQVRVIARLWRSPSTATTTVLSAIGELHPAKVVAKAARKALFQRRSWAAA